VPLWGVPKKICKPSALGPRHQCGSTYHSLRLIQNVLVLFLGSCNNQGLYKVIRERSELRTRMEASQWGGKGSHTSLTITPPMSIARKVNSDPYVKPCGVSISATETYLI
jgi:hypothetical protein